MLFAFQFQEGVSNYSNPHKTWTITVYHNIQFIKRLFTLQHTKSTSWQMEKSAAPGQQVSFTLSLQNLQDRWWCTVILRSCILRNLFKVAIHWHIWSWDFWTGRCMSGTLTTFIMILDSLWPFQALLQSPLRLPGSSDPQCSSPGRRCVCSSHQVRQQFRNITGWPQSLQTKCSGHSHLFGALPIKFKLKHFPLFSRKLRLQLSPKQPKMLLLSWRSSGHALIKRHIRPFCADLFVN